MLTPTAAIEPSILPNSMKSLSFAGPAIVALMGTSVSALGQWTSQQITLNPGWNAVHLEVDPETADADAVFAGIPIESAWEWRRIQPPTQFVQDANVLLPKSPEWSTWFPPTSPRRILTDLFALKGGKPLLINLGGSAAVTLTVVGRPARPQNEWLSSGYSLAGMPVDPAAPPTFQSYFANSTGHAGVPPASGRPLVFALNASGAWASLVNTAPIQSGRAYWVQTVGPADYEGPLRVRLDSSNGLHFGSNREQADLRFANLSTVGNRTVTIQLLNSLPRPATALDSPVVAGPVALSYRDLSVITSTEPVAPWLPLNGPISVIVAPGQERLIQLAVRRKDLADPSAASGPDHTYQSLLQVKEGGMRQLIAVSAVQESPAAGGARSARGGGAAPNRSGLWMGSVAVNAVSWAGDKAPTIVQANPAFNGTDRTTPRPTPTEFQFKLMVHVDQNGASRLLQRVIQVWQDGTYVPDPLNPGTLLPDAPGAYRLFTDEQAANGAGFTGTALRDGKFVARRISSANFGIRQPVAFAGGAVFGTGSLTASVVTGYNDPLSPYKHAFHPQHDNLNALYSQTLQPGVESYSVNRALTLQFDAAHPFGRGDDPSWGSSIFGGTYLETLTGPHRRPIYIRGKFLLSRVSSVNRLN